MCAALLTGCALGGGSGARPSICTDAIQHAARSMAPTAAARSHLSVLYTPAMTDMKAESSISLATSAYRLACWFKAGRGRLWPIWLWHSSA